MVTNVTSLLKTVKAVEDEHTRGTRALEATIEAIAQEIRVRLSFSNPMKYNFMDGFSMVALIFRFPIPGFRFTRSTARSTNHSRGTRPSNETSDGCNRKSSCGGFQLSTGWRDRCCQYWKESDFGSFNLLQVLRLQCGWRHARATHACGTPSRLTLPWPPPICSPSRESSRLRSKAATGSFLQGNCDSSYRDCGCWTVDERYVPPTGN